MRNYDKFVTVVRQNNKKLSREEKITVILLAENYGYRMKSYGPISLIEIDNKALLEHQLDVIASVFVDFEVIVCSGYETQRVYQFVQSKIPRHYNVRIVENQVFYHSNCCEGLRLCMNNTVNNKILVCGGGVMLTSEYLRSLALKRSSILTQDGDKENSFDVGVISNDSKLETMSLAIKDVVWTELLYLNGEATIKSFYNVISKPEFKTKFLFEALNEWKGRKQLTVCKNQSKQPVFKLDNINTLKRISTKYENSVS